MSEQENKVKAQAGHPRPNHGRQPASVKGKGYACASRTLDERRRPAGMNQTEVAGKQCRRASNMTAGEQAPSLNAQERKAIQDTWRMLSRAGYTAVVHGHKTTARSAKGGTK